MGLERQAGLAARLSAINILNQVLSGPRSLDAVLSACAKSDLMSGLTQQDRALARAIVATALRRKGQIDDLIDKFTSTPLNRKKSGIVYEALLIGAAQLLFLRVPPHAAIDLSVRAVSADKRGGSKLCGFVNALLRTIEREGQAVVDGHDSARLNTPGWLYESWTKAYGGPGARAIAKAHMGEPPVDLTVVGDRAGWAERLSAVPVGLISVRLASPGPIEKLNGFNEGSWWVQDVAATLPALLLGNVENKQVLDLCAAPGGKTAQLAAAKAKVTAVDFSKPRLARLRDNLDRLGLGATIVHCDVLDLDQSRPADAVLLDAPCSATGTIRRHPDIPHLKTKSAIKALVKIQSQLLQKAIRLVKPGGLLVYCTCSLQPEEGERQIDKLLSASPQMQRVPICAQEIGGLPGSITPYGDLRTMPYLDPGAAGGMDGFFAARLRKKQAL